MTHPFLLFSGTANRDLGVKIAHQLGISLGDCQIKRFPDGEISIEINEFIEEKIVFILQPISPPVDANLVELLAFADACRRGAARHLIAIMPYFGYSRGDY